ncbi:lysophosphatidylcholine acyltransferase 2-like isoform X3 [Amphiura filiformis]
MKIPLYFLGRLQFFLFGFHWVRTKGTQASVDEAPILVVAPHTSFFDPIIGFMTGLPGSLNRIENSKWPIFGTLVNFLQPVYVSRKDPNSRLNTIKEIKRRCQPNSGWPQIVIFPEGTCTNRTCLISFKGGAFYPGVPVQPIAMRYLTKPDTFTWTWDGPGAFSLLWLTMCNFDNKLELEFLPVYKPSQAEIDDPKLFANNVRAVIANALNLPVTDHTYEDCRLMEHARAKGLPLVAGIVEFQKILNKLGLKLETLQEQLDRFAEIAQSEGYVTIDDLAKYLNVSVSPALEEMFALYDRDGTNKIDFREYVIGCSLVAETANGEETLELAFRMFGGDKGYITSEDLTRILGSSFEMKKEECETLFKLVDKDESGQITFDGFREYAKKKPEYAQLFMTYQKQAAPQQTNGGHSIGNGNGMSKKSE